MSTVFNMASLTSHYKSGKSLSSVQDCRKRRHLSAISRKMPLCQYSTHDAHGGHLPSSVSINAPLCSESPPSHLLLQSQFNYILSLTKWNGGGKISSPPPSAPLLPNVHDGWEGWELVGLRWDGCWWDWVPA